MQDIDFDEIVELIFKEDNRYDKKAYLFVRQGLAFTVAAIKKNDPARAKSLPHVSGKELLDGLRAFALEQFGPMTKTVLGSWGIHRCSDFGDIVFSLIDYNIFSKTDSDRREDFGDLYDFDDAFVSPFRPAGGAGRRASSGEPRESV